MKRRYSDEKTAREIEFDRIVKIKFDHLKSESENKKFIEHRETPISKIRLSAAVKIYKLN